MLENQPLSNQTIIDCLHTHYGIKIVSLRLLPLGADINASVYKAQEKDQSSYFLKIKRGHNHDMGITIVQQLHEAGVRQIIPPIKTVHGESAQSIGDFTLILYPFIDGQDGFTRALSDSQWLTLGKTLKQVHEMDVPSLIKQNIRQETFSSKWREITRSLYARIETQITDDKVASQLLTFMKKNRVTIQRLVDRAEQLAEMVQNQSLQLVLCHSDIHGGNVLMNDHTIYIVDWDDPIMAPKERDLMFIGGGVANVWNKPFEEALFYEGYGTVKIDKTILAYYRHERIVEDIAEYGQELLLTTSGGENRAEMYKHFIAMFAPRGVVDIAFQTDESLGD